MKIYSKFEKFLLGFSDPVNFVFSVVGAVILCDGLLRHSFWLIFLAIILLGVGNFYVWGQNRSYDEKKLNVLEKLLLSVNQPVNLVLHIIAILIAIMALWKNNWSGFWVAVIIAFIGHLYVWLSKTKKIKI